MRNLNTVEFKRVPLCAKFSRNGDAWVKSSTRTATVTEYNHTFYFRQRDIVEVSDTVKDQIIQLENAQCNHLKV